MDAVLPARLPPLLAGYFQYRAAVAGSDQRRVTGQISGLDARFARPPCRTAFGQLFVADPHIDGVRHDIDRERRARRK